MNLSFDTIIAGAGLAGTAAALYLSREEAVLVLEAREPASGASGAAAGLANPLMARKARPVWRMDEALEAFHEALTLAGATKHFSQQGILRPAAAPRQARFFEEAANTHPSLTEWLDVDTIKQRYLAIQAPHGGLWVKAGGALEVPTLVKAFLDQAVQQGACFWPGTPVSGWQETRTGVAVSIIREGQDQKVRAKRLLLAVGQDFMQFPAIQRLNLHGIKGQTVRVQTPDGAADILPLAGRGYAIFGPQSTVLGSSYQHTFTDLLPDPTETRRILEKTGQMVPALSEASVLDASAGVRVTVPGTRLPMLGPLPGSKRVWVFTGLGSKGLLMAPLLARELLACFKNPERIPDKLNVG